jgi:hypothetical protein
VLPSYVLIDILEILLYNLWPCVIQSGIFQMFRRQLRNVKKNNRGMVELSRAGAQFMPKMDQKLC